MKANLVSLFYYLSKTIMFISSALLILHVLFIIGVFCNIKLPKFVGIDFIEYPKSQLLDKNNTYYIREKGGILKAIEKYPFNYQIIDKSNPSKKLEIEAVNIYFYINANFEKKISVMILFRRIIYLLFFVTICYLFNKIFSFFYKERSFVMKSVKQLKTMAFAFILLPIVLFIFNFVLFSILKQHQIQGGGEMISYDVKLQYMFFGLLILAIAEIFKHGANLQQEYNHTI